MLAQDLEVIKRTWGLNPSLDALHQSLLSPLLFPVAILQLPGGFQAALSAITAHQTGQTETVASSASKGSLLMIAPLLQAYITALKTGRYATFPPPTRSDVPAEIYVSGRVRNAVLAAVEACLKQIDQLGKFWPASDGKGLAWRAARGTWEAVERSSTYFEGESGWPKAVQSTIRQLEVATTQQPTADAAAEAAIMGTLRACLALDYTCAAQSADGQALRRILGWTLSVRPLT